MTDHDAPSWTYVDRSYAESRRLVWCSTCEADVEDGRILLDQFGGIVATYCDDQPCRRDGYADARMTIGTTAGCREVSA